MQARGPHHGDGRHRVRQRALSGLSALALLLGGCTTSGYTYVSNADLGAYFRVPSDYAVYDAEQVLEETTAGMPAESAEKVRQQQWAVAFDAGDEPAVDRFITQLDGPAPEPAGYARVGTLGTEERLQYSLQSLRGELLPYEELQQVGEQVSVLDVEEIHQEAGHGLRVVFSVGVEGETFVFEQLGLIDDTTSRVYLLALGCSAECFDSHRDEIAAISESWTIEER